MAKAIAGQVVKQTLYIHLSEYYTNGIYLNISDSTETLGYPCIGSFEVEFTIPEHDATKLQVEALENHLQALNAEHHMKTQNIKDQIQRLQAIGHDSNNNYGSDE